VTRNVDMKVKIRGGGPVWSLSPLLDPENDVVRRCTPLVMKRRPNSGAAKPVALRGNPYCLIGIGEMYRRVDWSHLTRSSISVTSSDVSGEKTLKSGALAVWKRRYSL